MSKPQDSSVYSATPMPVRRLVLVAAPWALLAMAALFALRT